MRRSGFEVDVLGPVVLRQDGRELDVSANQRLFVALLAAQAGRVVPTDQLVEVMWGANQPRRPVAALQNLVSRLRSRVRPEGPELVVTRPPGYMLPASDVSVDRVRFPHIVAEARAESERLAALAAYDAALGLWRGDPYAEFPDVEVLRRDARWLEEMCAVAREERLRLRIVGDPRDAVAECEALVAASPLRERPHALLMEALHACGRQRDALRVFTEWRETLAEESGLDPSPEMRRLEAMVLAGGAVGGAVAPVAAGTVVETEGPPDNLPARRTSFVGRTDDVVAVGAALDADRLVTLVGVGGAGKTSLAVEAARERTHRFPGGVWIVDLLQLVDGRRIAGYIAETVGLGALGPGDPPASLVERLGDLTALLVLDNCEHLIDDVAFVADAVLAGTGGVRLLATSREPLRVPGETVCRIDPLAVPAPDGTYDDVVTSASGRLLVDRIRSADPGIVFSDGDGPVLCAICRRLDGLPLALELAAARVPSLGIRQVADRLDNRFAILTLNHRGALPHHQTLRSAIAWSVDLLEDRERRLLGRLSVFAGGFELETVEAVCADETIAVGEVADLLARLVERSLVVTYRVDGRERHRLLETVREYATELAGADGHATRNRHRDHFASFARLVGDGYLVRTRMWYQRLRVEFPDLRRAFRWSLDNGDVGVALDLAGSLRWAPFNADHLYGEHREWVETALSRARHGQVDGVILARGLVVAGAVAGLDTRSAQAVSLLSEAVELLDELGEREEIVWCDMWLGAFTADLGELERSVEITGRGLATARELGSVAGIVYLANQHAENAMAAATLAAAPGHLDIARDAYDHAERHAADSGIEEGLLRAEHGLAVLRAQSDPVRAFEMCTHTLARWRLLGGGLRLIVALLSGARIALGAGDRLAARALLAETSVVVARVGYAQAVGRLAETAARCAMDSGDHDHAAMFAGAAAERFMTPRWHVPLVDGPVGEVPGHEAQTQAGRAMGDAELLELCRRWATGDPR